MAFYKGQEPDHSGDFRDYPLCARQCLLNEADGYPWTTCARSNGSCCPGAQPHGVKHFSVWDCVLKQCSSNEGHAQDAADIFLRECATHGYPLPPNFSVQVPSAYGDDHFPAEYRYTDFVVPAQHPSLSGFYGWGALLAWNFVLIAASFSGIRPSSRRQPGPLSSRVARRWIGYMRQDAELFAALAVAWVAAGDILMRSSRVSFHQVFNYAHPSFVAASDGDDKGSDILSIRAALVVVNHFAISAGPLAVFPLAVLSWKRRLRGCQPRQFLRTLAILVTLVWCNATTKSLICAWEPFPWFNSCGFTYFALGGLANVAGMLPGVSCLPSLYDVLVPLSPCIAAIIFLATLEVGTQLQGPVSVRYCSLIIRTFLILLITIPTMFSLILLAFWYLTIPWLGTILIPFWYIVSEGRQCTFGPSNVIGFSELDQIMALATGFVLSGVSIWDSISSFRVEA